MLVLLGDVINNNKEIIFNISNSGNILKMYDKEINQVLNLK